MTVTAAMPARCFDLVVPLGHEPTAMRMKDTAGSAPGRSCAVSLPIETGLRQGNVDSTNHRSPPRTSPTRGSRISTTATRTTTTRTTTTGHARSADETGAEFSFPELAAAYFDCRRTKRNTAAALVFEQDLEANLTGLYDELIAGTYRPGPSICFVITRPRPREVWAAQFRDRVVHHLLHNRIAHRFYTSFIADSCACIPGRGTLYAVQRLESKVRSITQNWKCPAWYLKCDVANFFVAIDKRILIALLARRVSEPWWLRLAELILFHDPRADVMLHSPPARLALIPRHKSLFAQPAHLGLPIGNLSSQFFANVYLNELDQLVKHELRARHYIRYVDDFVLLHESPQWLNSARAQIERFLPYALGLQLNPRKTILQPVERGIDFVGQVVKPWRRTLRRQTFNQALTRSARQPDEDLLETANSYFGLLRQATHSHGDRARLANVLRRRGRSIDSSFTKTYRKPARQR
jgi:RNA-directed DNA polymerase